MRKSNGNFLVPFVILMDGSVCSIGSTTNPIKTVCDFEDLVKSSIKQGYVQAELDQGQLCRLIPISSVREFNFSVDTSKCS